MGWDSRGVGQLRSGWQDKVTELTWAGVEPAHRLGTKASEVKRECSRCPSCSRCDVFELNTILLGRRTTCSPGLTSFPMLLAKGWAAAGLEGTGAAWPRPCTRVGTGMDVWGEAQEGRCLQAPGGCRRVRRGGWWWQGRSKACPSTPVSLCPCGNRGARGMRCEASRELLTVNGEQQERL